MLRLSVFLITLIILAGCSKRDRLGDFIEEHHPEKSFFLYPSTLRMVNLKKNPDFNEMISNLERGRYFSFPNDPQNNENIRLLEKELLEDGYEEVIEIKNKEINAKVLLLDKKKPILFASIINEEMINLLEIEGMINPLKIPDLMENFDDEEFLNLFEITNFDQKNPQREHTEHQEPQ